MVEMREAKGAAERKVELTLASTHTRLHFRGSRTFESSAALRTPVKEKRPRQPYVLSFASAVQHPAPGHPCACKHTLRHNLSLYYTHTQKLIGQNNLDHAHSCFTKACSCMSFYAKIHICAAVTWEDVQQQCSVKIPTVSHPFLYFMSAPQPKTYTSCKLNIQDFVSRVLLGILDTVLDHLHGVRCQNMRSEQTVEYLSSLLCVFSVLRFIYFLSCNCQTTHLQVRLHALSYSARFFHT